MPKGISLAPEIFQRKHAQVLDNLTGFYIYITDDILSSGQWETEEETEQDHDEKFR